MDLNDIISGPMRVPLAVLAGVVAALPVLGGRKTLVATGLGYAALLMWLVYVGVDAGRAFFIRLDPSLAAGHEERDYAEKCASSTENILDSLDVFILAHSLGYWAKMLILRDIRTVLMVSLIFEHLEVTFQHVLPNFLECWWDHMLLDIAICNALGMLVGWLTLKACGMQMYDWWAGSLSSESPKRFLQASLGLGIMLVSELCLFFLKFAMQHPPSHHFVLMRMAFWACASYTCYTEYYRYVVEAGRGFPGIVVFCMLLCFAESCLVFAFVDIRVPPAIITTPWVVFAVLLVVFVITHYMLPLRPVSLLFLVAGVAALSFSFVAGLPDVDLFGKDHLEQLLRFYE
eukprot:TRINITY_DN3511_c0_g4_i1.p1 TRINITY_DN3511_c0_g4~~TRINITY_DN3511_c0_g4_i1.p1  ORF type:complete len:364 (+),score=49.69 TRINITY_DN3511_c0_g4_i1:59-1093(+)